MPNTELQWDEVSERYYETGIRKTALYPYDTTSKICMQMILSISA